MGYSDHHGGRHGRITIEGVDARSIFTNQLFSNQRTTMTFLRNLVSLTGGVAITSAALLFFILVSISLFLTGVAPLVMLAVGLNGA